MRDKMRQTMKRVPWTRYSTDMHLSKLWELVMGREALACCSPWGHKESDTTERLNWTELDQTGNLKKIKILIFFNNYALIYRHIKIQLRNVTQNLQYCLSLSKMLPQFYCVTIYPQVSWLQTANIYSHAVHSAFGGVLAALVLVQLGGWTSFRLQVGWAWLIMSPSEGQIEGRRATRPTTCSSNSGTDAQGKPAPWAHLTKSERGWFRDGHTTHLKPQLGCWCVLLPRACGMLEASYQS